MSIAFLLNAVEDALSTHSLAQSCQSQGFHRFTQISAMPKAPTAPMAPMAPMAPTFSGPCRGEEHRTEGDATRLFDGGGAQDRDL